MRPVRMEFGDHFVTVEEVEVLAVGIALFVTVD